MLPKRLDRTPIYESQWINLYTDKVLMPSGKIIEKYHQLDYPKESVTILLTNSKNEICFIQSLRYTTQKIEWELPAGAIEKNETIVEAAQREIKEETGFEVDTIEHVYSYNPSNGMSNQIIHILFAHVKENTQTEFDHDEVKEVFWLGFQKIQELILQNQMTDGTSLLPLLFYFNHRFSIS